MQITLQLCIFLYKKGEKLRSSVFNLTGKQCIVKSTDTQLNEFGKSPVKKLHELQNTISIIKHGKIHNTLLNFKYVCVFDFEYGIGYLMSFKLYLGRV